MGFRLLPASSVGAMDLFSRVAAVEVRNFDPYTDNLKFQRQKTICFLNRPLDFLAVLSTTVIDFIIILD